MRAFTIIVLFPLLGLTSCNQSPVEKYFTQCFELNSKGDTINLIDSHKLRQGLWLMPFSKDTVVYRDDTAYSVTKTTSGEMIRRLRSGSLQGSIEIYESLVVKSN